MPAEPEAVDEVTVFADGEDPAEGEVEQMLARIVPGTALHPRTGPAIGIGGQIPPSTSDKRVAPWVLGQTGCGAVSC